MTRFSFLILVSDSMKHFPNCQFSLIITLKMLIYIFPFTLPASFEWIKYPPGIYIRRWGSEVSTPYRLFMLVPNGPSVLEAAAQCYRTLQPVVHCPHTHTLPAKDIAHVSWLTNERAIWLAWPTEKCSMWDGRRSDIWEFSGHRLWACKQIHS